MKTIYKHKSATWVDLAIPTPDEVKEVEKEYKLDHSIADDLTSPTIRHTVSFTGDHAYMVLHFPVFKDNLDEDAAYELDFVVGKDHVLTCHYRKLQILEKFGSDLTTWTSEAKDSRNALFFGILNMLVSDIDEKLSKIDHWVRDLEKSMFKGGEKKTIFEMSEASRHLIDFKKITAVYGDSFKELNEHGKEMFGKEFSDLLLDTSDSFERIKSKLETLLEAVHELRETNASILSTKQNETMKVLTTVTVIATIIVGIALIWVGLLAIK